MHLTDAIRLNEELTAALAGALATADDEAAAGLLVRREGALAALAEALRAAEPAARTAHRGRLEALVAADRDLQAAAGAALTAAGEALAVHATAPGRPPAGDGQPRHACLDRRA